MVTIYRQRKIYLLACVCILLLDIAIFWPFVLDDAWISFRYAQAWNNGFGLVFNPGEVVEGYTNFLWTIVIGLLMRLGLDPLVAAKLFGVLLTLLTLLVTDELGVHLSFRGSSPFQVLPVLLLSINVCFAACAVAGMETQLFTLLLVLGVYQTVQNVVKQALCCFPFPFCPSVITMIEGHNL